MNHSPPGGDHVPDDCASGNVQECGISAAQSPLAPRKGQRTDSPQGAPVSLGADRRISPELIEWSSIWTGMLKMKRL